jgi:hypothetical protein
VNWFDAVYMDPLMGGSNILRVGKDPGMHNTIQAAVDAVENPGENNPWTIIVAPGEYVEYVDLYRDEDHKKSYVSLYLLPGAKVKSPPAEPPQWGSRVLRLHDHCELHGGYVENTHDRDGKDDAVATTQMYPGVSDALAIVVRGVRAHALNGKGFRITTDALVTDCLATGGGVGFHGSFSNSRVTKGQSIYFINCAAFVASNEEERALRATHEDYHGYLGSQLAESGVVHFIRCTGLAYSSAPGANASARGLHLEDGNLVIVGCSFAGLTGDAGAAPVEVGGGWVNTEAPSGGIAYVLGSALAGVAEGSAAQAFGMEQHHVTMASSAFAARVIGAGQNSWERPVWFLLGRNMATWAGGSTGHLATPVTAQQLGKLDKDTGLILFDTTPELDPEHPQDPLQPWLKYCEATHPDFVWKKIRNVRT